MTGNMVTKTMMELNKNYRLIVIQVLVARLLGF